MKNRMLVVAPCLIGIIGLGALMRNPRFDSFHVVDVLQLLASGMCFGVALAGLLRTRNVQG